MTSAFAVESQSGWARLLYFFASVALASPTSTAACAGTGLLPRATREATCAREGSGKAFTPPCLLSEGHRLPRCSFFFPASITARWPTAKAPSSFASTRWKLTLRRLPHVFSAAACEVRPSAQMVHLGNLWLATQ